MLLLYKFYWCLTGYTDGSIDAAQLLFTDGLGYLLMLLSYSTDFVSLGWVGGLGFWVIHC